MTHSNDPKSGPGALRDDQSQLMLKEGFSFSGYERDPLYLNMGNHKFKDISGVSGIDSITDGRAAVFADFDNDGDLDVFMTTIQGESHLLFRNNVGQSNHNLRILLEGSPEAGRDALGAVVRVRTSAGTLTKIKAGGAGFLSQSDPRLLFGLGRDERAEWIEVTWPGGEVERFEGDAAAGSTLRLRQGSGRAEHTVLARTQLPDPLSPAESLARRMRVVVGQPVPDLPLVTLEGAATSLHQQLRPGRRTLVNLWATWCAPCRYEMPELENLRASLAARGFDILGLNVDTDSTVAMQPFLERTGVRYPVVRGGVPAIEQLYATDELTVPVTFVVDEKGVLLEFVPGWSPASRRRFAALAGLEAEAATPGRED